MLLFLAICNHPSLSAVFFSCSKGAREQEYKSQHVCTKDTDPRDADGVSLAEVLRHDVGISKQCYQPDG